MKRDDFRQTFRDAVLRALDEVSNAHTATETMRFMLTEMTSDNHNPRD